MVDIIFIIAFLSLLIIPPLVFQLWPWVISMSILGGLVGIIELIYKVSTGKTISRIFWNWAWQVDVQGNQPNKWKAWIILSCWQLAFWLLMIHLAWKA